MTATRFKATTPTDWLTVDAVTQVLGCSAQRVLQLVQAGKLNGRMVNDEPRISDASLNRYLEEHPHHLVTDQPRTYVRTARGVIEEI